MSDISDSELRTQLKSHGVKVGPITASTRSVYLKKLKEVESASQPNQNRRKSTQPPSPPPTRPTNLTKATAAEFEPELTRRPTWRQSLPAKPQAPIKTTESSKTEFFKTTEFFKPTEIFKRPETSKRPEVSKPLEYSKPDLFKRLETPKIPEFSELPEFQLGFRNSVGFSNSAPRSSYPRKYENANVWSGRRRWWHVNANTSRILLFLFGSFMVLLAVLYELTLNKSKLRVFGKIFYGAASDTVSFIYNRMVFPALIIGIVGGLVVGAIWYKRYKSNKAAEEQQQVFSMVEKILAILKKQYDESLIDTNRQPYLAVPHVRDMLIPVTKRKQLLPIWDKAVQYLNENESRVRTENQIISGEEFMVWRWLQVGGGAGDVDEKVWQGHAFPEEQAPLNMPNCLMFECLKLRGLFDPDFEQDDDDWPEHIQDAILEKLGSSIRVIHVAIDTESKEGCVYLKLGSKEEAATAFKILHGSWFNGRLVTVKYLRTERYNERFPESKRCTFPLRVKKPRHSLLG